MYIIPRIVFSFVLFFICASSAGQPMHEVEAEAEGDKLEELYDTCEKVQAISPAVLNNLSPRQKMRINALRASCPGYKSGFENLETKEAQLEGTLALVEKDPQTRRLLKTGKLTQQPAKKSIVHNGIKGHFVPDAQENDEEDDED